ncbi:MAG: hypothetical protein HKL80_03300, partial [Acidimicrobiales bacterium]|nr:hypothetical protein [Acidimicrobiales bacterium]
HLTINRPERRNALSPQVLLDLRKYFQMAKSDPEVRCVVLKGTGDKAFCAGADLGGNHSIMDAPSAQSPSLVEQHYLRGELADLFLDMWHLGKPVIARVQGYGMAGGFGLAMACDIVIASQSAIFGATEVAVGLWPFMISVPLTRSMPPKIALELMMTGRRVKADEAKSIGFVNRVVEDSQLDSVVEEVVEELKKASPVAMKLGRDSLYATWGMEPHQALEILRGALSLTTLTEDAREGITAFLEKRPPNWSGR